jgi:hypothetical protein
MSPWAGSGNGVDMAGMSIMTQNPMPAINIPQPRNAMQEMVDDSGGNGSGFAPGNGSGNASSPGPQAAGGGWGFMPGMWGNQQQQQQQQFDPRMAAMMMQGQNQRVNKNEYFDPYYETFQSSVLQNKGLNIKAGKVNALYRVLMKLVGDGGGGGGSGGGFQQNSLTNPITARPLADGTIDNSVNALKGIQQSAPSLPGGMSTRDRSALSQNYGDASRASASRAANTMNRTLRPMNDSLRQASERARGQFDLGAANQQRNLQSVNNRRRTGIASPLLGALMG